MGIRAGIGWLTVFFVFSASVTARAQCTKDIDCKGDRVCEGGRCIASPPPAPPPPGPMPPSTADFEAGPQPVSPPPATPAPAAPVAQAAAPAVAAPAAAPAAPVAEEPQTRRNNVPLMVGGITLVSIAPVLLIIAAVAAGEKSSCNRYPVQVYDPVTDSFDTIQEDCDRYDPTIYGFTIGGLALFAAGIPMFVIGARRVPIDDKAKASISPWVGRDGAGATLRLDL